MPTSKSSEFIIQLNGVSFCYSSGMDVLSGMSLSIRFEERLIIIKGENGSGKTTLLNLISGELQPTNGLIQYGISPLHDICCQFQKDGLFGKLSVEENLRATGLPPNVIEKTIELFGLQGLKQRRADQLSGGEERRVQMARCKILDRRVWLLDEPTAGMDKGWSERTTNIIMDAFLNDRTVIISTHDFKWLEKLQTLAAEEDARVIQL